LPDDSLEARRWAYGDWDYYALRKTSLWDGIVAMLWPSQGALGQMPLGVPVQVDAVQAALGGIGVEHAYAIHVERERARQLHQELSSLYQRRIETEVNTPEVGFRFVHHPTRYTFFCNSNHAAAGWLRRLGCRVSGPTFHSNWRLVQAREDE
jgi:hypothetical protein